MILRLNTLRPEIFFFKAVIFNHFVHSIGLGVPLVEIKAIIINITRSSKELETLPGKAQKSKSSKKIPIMCKKKVFLV